LANDGIKQVIINVSAKDFNIKCSEEFADFIEADIDLISKGSKKIELKQLVESYIKRSYDYYTLQKELKKLLTTLNNELPIK